MESIISEVLKLRGSFFFLKSSKFNVDSKNAIKLLQHVFGVLDNCIWIGSGKFCLLLQEYSHSAVSVLTSNPEISDLTKNDFF